MTEADEHALAEPLATAFDRAVALAVVVASKILHPAVGRHLIWEGDMAAGLFGVSWTEMIDYLIKLAPAASIVGGIFAARAQLRNNRRINAEMIAKNHYREMLDAFSKNSDIVYMGSNAASFAELKKDIPRYRRYRLLFTLMVFAMQEMYLAMDLKREKNWEHSIRVFISLFKHFILSPEDYTPYQHRALTPIFLAFLMDTARNFEHSMARTSVAQYLNDESRLTK